MENKYQNPSATMEAPLQLSVHRTIATRARPWSSTCLISGISTGHTVSPRCLPWVLGFGVLGFYGFRVASSLTFINNSSTYLLIYFSLRMML